MPLVIMFAVRLTQHPQPNVQLAAVRADHGDADRKFQPKRHAQ